MDPASDVRLRMHSDAIVGDIPRVVRPGSAPITSAQAQAWVAKARILAAPLLELAGRNADPARVVPNVVVKETDRLYGNFMLAWLDNTVSPRVVNHLPDASFFLRLLDICYAPVFTKRPDLRRLLDGSSRPEMSLTNDVLQIQLHTNPDNYTMIRHHALMLFYAALWLDEPQRSGWLTLYDELATYVDNRPQGRPSLEELAAVERGAFEDFRVFAPRTLRDGDPRLLLSERTTLRRILDYQLYSAVAIGLLWRSFRDVPEGSRAEWHREQLSAGYTSPDYLEQTWVSVR